MAQMTTPQVHLGRAQDRSLWRYLWAWAFGAVVALWMLLAGLAYSTGYHEAEEISDGLLVSAAQLLLSQPLAQPLLVPGTPNPPTVHQAEMPAALSQHPPNAYAPEFHVVIWQGERLVWDSHGVHAQLPPRLALGHQTLGLTLQGVSQDWRVYVAESTEATAVRRVAVFMDPAWREALAADISEHILLPALVFLPLVALMLASAIRRGLLPLQRLSGKIAALDVDAGQTLVPQQPYRELGVTVQSINALVLRLQAQIGRERRFAADVAQKLVGHEHVDRAMDPSMGAEDFSFMLQVKPGAYLRLGQGLESGMGGCYLHNSRYDFNDDVLPLGAALHASLVEHGMPLTESA